jgi:hypothetical protein
MVEQFTRLAAAAVAGGLLQNRPDFRAQRRRCLSNGLHRFHYNSNSRQQGIGFGNGKKFGHVSPSPITEIKNRPHQNFREGD